MPRSSSLVAVAPLASRVPNPPASFVGREAELRGVRAALRRGNVVVVCGLGGLGKTSLALAALKKSLPGRIRAAVMIGVRPQPLQQTLVEILRALGPLARPGAGGDEWSALPTGEELLALALDLAEESDAVVVLDDLHHAPDAGLEVLVTAARFARRSLWIATSRIEPEAPELAGQIVRLGPLPDGKLAALAKLIAPRTSSAAVREAVRAASGSPWRLRSTLLGEPSRDSPLDALTVDARALLDVLAMAERVLSPGALARIVGREEIEGETHDLARRGLVELTPSGIRLHDAARPWVLERLDPAAKSRVASSLAGSGDAAEAIEALRLLVASGDEGSARALCEARFAAMLRAGYAPTLWKLVSPLSAHAWYPWKLRAAMQLASVDVIALGAPPADSPWERVLWTRALLVAGALGEARSSAESLASSAPGSGAVVFWAGLLRAMAIHHAEGAELAVDPLRGLAPPDAACGELRDVLLAFWLAECGRIDEALAVLGTRDASPREAEGDGPDVLGAPVSFFTRYYRMAALMECGHIGQAHAAMTRGARDDVGEELAASRVAGNALVNLAIARGHLAEARARLERIARAPVKSAIGDVTALLAIEEKIASGELAGAELAIERLQADTRERMPLVHAWCFETRERVAVLLGKPCEAELDVEALPLGPGTRGIVALRRALHEARWGEPKTTLGANPRDVEGRILHAMLESTLAIAARRNGAEPARLALDLATEHGWGMRELEARALLAESLVASPEKRAEARVEIEALDARAKAIGSRRFSLDAACLREIACGGIDPSLLEEIADAFDVAPVSARRARALLGGSASLDLVDRVVVEAAMGARVRTIGAPAGWQRGWGLDVDRKILWREDGSTVPLERHALYMRILSTLAQRGGTASIEDLARDVWSVRNFRPLSDGNRIRVTMHRIRSLVGQDRIVLRDAGYALGGPPFRVAISSASAPPPGSP